MFISREITSKLEIYRQVFPVVALLGPRQCGKSTLIKTLTQSWPEAIYLDLQAPNDYNKLSDPVLFFQSNTDKIICLDEIQLKPDLFSVLRSEIDLNRQNGRFILLGSASRDLVQRSSETLAGRIGYLNLSPFSLHEVANTPTFELNKFWLRGGFPLSFLADSDEFSAIWREQFIQTYVERDLPQLGINIPAMQMRRFITMCAHVQGQVLNLSKLGDSMAVTHPTIRRYVDILEQTFIARSLHPFETNLKKRLVKSPKLYIRDTGLLHAILGITDFNSLLGNPVLGQSWETLVIENILTSLPEWQPFFYRTAQGDEIDLIIVKGNRIIAVECKASSAPKLTPGNHRGIADVKPEHTYVIAPLISESYPLAEEITACSLDYFLTKMKI